MKRLLLLFAAVLMASTGMWAETQNVGYSYPVYNTEGDPASGIKEWKTARVDATVVKKSESTVVLGEADTETWYVVAGTDVRLSNGAVCQGDVNLILADGAKLTATGDATQAGICVSGKGNSFTIYGQTYQSGKLEAKVDAGAGIGGNGEGGEGSNITINGGIIKAVSDWGGAGIGGGSFGNGSNITINGGTVTATGGDFGAGIGGGGEGSGSYITINGGMVTATGGNFGAGIGGGDRSAGSFIAINGGTVIANGGDYAACIGSGDEDPGSSNIFVATSLIIKADNNNPPMTVIKNTGSDLASSLAGKRYVTITEPYFNITANQDPDHKQNYYATFYSSAADYQVPSGVTAYTGAVDGDVLKLTAIEDNIIPASQGVILRLTTEDNAETQKQFVITLTTEAGTWSGTNALTGTDVAKTLGANDYALSLGQKGVGFYLWNGLTLGANKAYLTWEGSKTSAKAFSFKFDNGGTTSIRSVNENENEDENLYNLNGMRVGKNYKGIVIKNGKKIYNK